MELIEFIESIIMKVYIYMYILIQNNSYFFQELHVELKGLLVGPSYSLEVERILLNLRVH